MNLLSVRERAEKREELFELVSGEWTPTHIIYDLDFDKKAIHGEVICVYCPNDSILYFGYTLTDWMGWNCDSWGNAYSSRPEDSPSWALGCSPVFTEYIRNEQYEDDEEVDYRSLDVELTTEEEIEAAIYAAIDDYLDFEDYYAKWKEAEQELKGELEGWKPTHVIIYHPINWSGESKRLIVSEYGCEGELAHTLDGWLAKSPTNWDLDSRGSLKIKGKIIEYEVEGLDTDETVTDAFNEAVHEYLNSKITQKPSVVDSLINRGFGG